jgi:excisionase family DNA binding protein
VTDRPAGEDKALELLKSSEVARLLGVTRSTVLSWAYRGLLDYATTPGGHLRFFRDQVETIRTAGQHRPDEATSKQRPDE